MPYSQYAKYLNGLDRQYHQSNSTFIKPVFFITPEGQEYLAKRIENYLQKQAEDQEKTAEENIPVKLCSSPLDMNKEQALEYLAGLPEFLKDSFFAIELRKKWGIAD